MGALDAFDVMTDAVSRNPVLFGAAAVIGVASTVMNAAGQIPLVGLLVGFLYFFVEPFLAGGYLGMANEAVSGETSFGTFTEAGKENYGDLLVARLLVAAVLIAYLVVVTVLAAFVVGMGVAGATGGAGGEPTLSSSAMSAIGVLGIVVAVGAFVAYAVPYVFLQFYPAAIVIGDAGPVESFRYSFALVKANFVSVLGYTAIAFALGLLLLVPTILGGQSQVAARALGRAATDSVAGGVVSGFLTRIVVFVATFVVVKTIVVAVVRTYYVSFVRSVTGTA